MISLPSSHPILARILRPKEVELDAQAELQYFSAATIVIFSVYVDGWVGSCVGSI